MSTSQMSEQTTSELELRYLILNTKEPLVIKDSLHWELVKWDLDKWRTVLDREHLPFRRGKNVYTKEPQFENTTDTVYITFKEFLTYQEKNPQEWLYFDYKYLKEWLVNVPEFQKYITWKDFGFPELDFEDSTIWIGSKGAHTSCHIDTYGCNIIAQIYGRKRWILFPPEENLQSTRIPYEESSIYSKINLFTPSVDDFKNVSNCRTIVLNPGDVLILPHKWWHYVENVDLAVSINTWIKLPVDHEERIGEAVVRLLISQITKQLNPNQKHLILNLNEKNSVIEDNATESIAIILTCLEMYKKERSSLEFPLGNYCIEQILQKWKNVEPLEKLSDESFKMLLEIQKNKFDCEDVTEIANLEKDDEILVKKVINALVHDDVIKLIKQKLLES